MMEAPQVFIPQDSTFNKDAPIEDILKVPSRGWIFQGELLEFYVIIPPALFHSFGWGPLMHLDAVAESCVDPDSIPKVFRHVHVRGALLTQQSDVDSAVFPPRHVALRRSPSSDVHPQIARRASSPDTLAIYAHRPRVPFNGSKSTNSRRGSYPVLSSPTSPSNASPSGKSPSSPSGKTPLGPSGKTPSIPSGKTPLGRRHSSLSHLGSGNLLQSVCSPAVSPRALISNNPKKLTIHADHSWTNGRSHALSEFTVKTPRSLASMDSPFSNLQTVNASSFHDDSGMNSTYSYPCARACDPTEECQVWRLGSGEFVFRGRIVVFISPDFVSEPITLITILDPPGNEYLNEVTQSRPDLIPMSISLSRQSRSIKMSMSVYAIDPLQMSCSASMCSSKMLLSIEVSNRSCHSMCLRDGLELSVADLSADFSVSKRKGGEVQAFSDEVGGNERFDDFFDVFMDRTSLPLTLSPLEEYSFLVAVSPKRKHAHSLLVRYFSDFALKALLSVRWKCSQIVADSSIVVQRNFDCPIPDRVDINAVITVPSIITIRAPFAVEVRLYNHHAERADFVLFSSPENARENAEIYAENEHVLNPSDNMVPDFPEYSDSCNGSSDLICLESSVHVGEVAPSSFALATLHYLPLRSGLLRLRPILVVDKRRKRWFCVAEDRFVSVREDVGGCADLPRSP
eukprot:342728_1